MSSLEDDEIDDMRADDRWRRRRESLVFARVGSPSRYEPPEYFEEPHDDFDDAA